jgi:hypothetical protein
MGATHFLTKTLARVSTEMSLHVLAYNMKRVMRLLGIGGLIEAMRAWAQAPFCAHIPGIRLYRSTKSFIGRLQTPGWSKTVRQPRRRQWWASMLHAVQR